MHFSMKKQEKREKTSVFQLKARMQEHMIEGQKDGFPF